MVRTLRTKLANVLQRLVDVIRPNEGGPPPTPPDVAPPPRQ